MRTIIHVDMDCFYAAIEERENPALKGKPVGVGGRSRRGVLTTANYEARKFGCRSAMPAFKALELCPHLILVPVQFDLYRAESRKIRGIFERFTSVIEPLSLDEAYLDVTHLNTEGAVVAREIRQQIFEETQLTASAGIAPNKMLAKVASDWEKPDGQYEVRPEGVGEFVEGLPVRKIPGVGKVMGEKLAGMGVTTCGDLQAIDQVELAKRFGKWGVELYDLCRGKDERAVKVERVRKSMSKERTFRENIGSQEELLEAMEELRKEVGESLASKHGEARIKSLFVKLKFADFETTTAEKAGVEFEPEVYGGLLAAAWKRGEGREVRLLGVGVKFADEGKEKGQMELF
ncbi:MAG: DNA polymerase IV [Verrucomicrobiota bacterium]